MIIRTKFWVHITKSKQQQILKTLHTSLRRLSSVNCYWHMIATCTVQSASITDQSNNKLIVTCQNIRLQPSRKTKHCYFTLIIDNKLRTGDNNKTTAKDNRIAQSAHSKTQTLLIDKSSAHQHSALWLSVNTLSADGGVRVGYSFRTHSLNTRWNWQTISAEESGADGGIRGVCHDGTEKYYREIPPVSTISIGAHFS